MSKSLRVIVVTVGMAFGATSLAADTAPPDLAALQAERPSTSIQHLYEECMAADLHEQMFCAGYINAAMDSMIVLGADTSSARAFGICPKVAVTAGAGAQVFKNWAQKHPEAWGLMRYVGVAWALKETWPCT